MFAVIRCPALVKGAFMLLKNLHHKLVMQMPQLLRLPVSLIPFSAKKICHGFYPATHF